MVDNNDVRETYFQKEQEIKLMYTLILYKFVDNITHKAYYGH